MKSGKYYVGDLCYVLGDRWDEVCDLIITPSGTCLNGEFELKDGTQFAMYSTAHGDGEYLDQHGNAYLVDSGSIGCVLFDDITEGEFDKIGGNTFDFDKDFTTDEENGKIRIGPIVIDTLGEDYFDEDYDEDEDY